MTEDRFIEIYDNLDEKFAEEDLEYAVDNFDVVQERVRNDGDPTWRTYITVVKIKNRFFAIVWDRSRRPFDGFHKTVFYTGDIEEVFSHRIEKIVYY